MLSDLTAGTKVVMTFGSYSDYYTLGVFLVLKDFNASKESQNWVANLPEKTSPYCSTGYKHQSPDAFLAHLVNEGFLEEIEQIELHLGDYGELKPEIW